MGRTSTYSHEISEEICYRLMEGETLREICRDENMPAWRTVYDWKAANEDFAARFARARDIGFDAIAEDTIKMIDETPGRIGTAFGEKVDAGHVTWQRNRVEQRLKLLAKWSPTRYGEKMALTDGEGKPLAASQVAPVINVTVRKK